MGTRSLLGLLLAAGAAVVVLLAVDLDGSQRPTGERGLEPARVPLARLRESLERAGPAHARPVVTPDPEAAFAPLVHLHERERWLPVGAREFIDGSVLKWANDDGCPDETVAVGRASSKTERETWEVIDEAQLGPERPYQRSPDAPDCDPPHRPVSFFADERTRPYARDARLPRLDLGEGFYLDLARARRRGRREPAEDGSRTYVRGVPAYVERDAEEVGRHPALRLTYWLLYGFDEPRGSEGVAHAIGHEGDWERVSVLLRRGHRPHRYLPTSVRYELHGDRLDVPWQAAERVTDRDGIAVGASHPVVFGALGSHAPYPRSGRYESDHAPSGGPGVTVEDDAIACPTCPRWETWKLLRAARAQPWYGFGGAWGEVGRGSGTTGPLGPGAGRPEHPIDGS